MFRVLRLFFEDLLEGDPVALIAGGVIAAVALAVCLFWWKTARDLRREDERNRPCNIGPSRCRRREADR
jgi:hypothetical protein